MEKDKKSKTISVSHINIRQSISMLLLKLIFLEAIAAVIFIVFRTTFLSTQAASVIPYIDIYTSGFFLLGVFLKTLLTIYVILNWINEYYEIYPELLTHKKGIIWVKIKHISLKDIQSIGVEQGIIGKIFNFGTLSLFDWKLRKYQYLYGIHNPMKYVKVIESLLPGIDEEKSILRERAMEEEN